MAGGYRSALLCFGLVAAVRAQPVDFAKEIAPILEARCAGCHQEGRGAGGFVATQEGAEKAAGSGLLLRVVSGEKPRMPKGGKPLTAPQVALLERWGAEQGSWWSLRPLPKLAGGSIDRFIRTKLQAAGLSPSPEADRKTLIRRLTFDLHGLPPTAAEVAAFVADTRADAYERLVDRLLASPRYGERWARHWLDLVHYGDSHGYDKDKPRANAWPYRDAVIRALGRRSPAMC
jgi:hypothetical protein